MPIYRRGPNSWQVKVRDHQGRWWTITVHSRGEAERAEREMLTAKDRGQEWLHPRDRQGQLTVRRACEVFIEAKRRSLSRRTLLRYGHELEEFCSWGERQHRAFLMSHMSRPLLRRYYAHLNTEAAGRWGRARKPQTANKVLRTVQIWWTWVWEHDDEQGWEGMVPRARRLELPKVAPPLTVAPTWGEMDDLIGELEDLEWARRLAWIQRFTALRVGEALSLTWGDLDLEGRRLVLQPEHSKGGYSGRVLPLSAHLVAELERWPKDDGPLCGPQSEGLRVTSRPARTFNRAWRRTQVRELAWKRQPTHALRKGVVSGLLALGANRDSVEVFAGHAITGSRVSYLDPEIALDLRAVADLIPGVGESDEA